MKKIRIFAFTLALTMGISAFTGCSGIGGIRKEDGATLEISMDNSWSTEQAMQNMSHGPLFNLGNHLLCAKYLNSGGTEYLWYDMESGEKTRFQAKVYDEIDPLERVSTQELLLPDGNIGVFCQIYQNLGGGEMEIHRQCIEVYDRGMNYLETREVPLDFGTHPDFPDERSHHHRMMDGNGNWIICHSNWDTGAFLLESFNSNFERYGEIEYSVSQDRTHHSVPNLFNGTDGTVYMVIHCGDIGEYYEKVYRLDAENRTCEETKMTIPFENGQSAGCFRAGTQDYDYCYCTYYGLYGVKNDERVKIVDWINSDFMPGEVSWFLPMEDGTFILRDQSNRYWKAVPRSQEEIESTKLISLATVEHSEDLIDAVMDYNREDSGYRIIVKDYSEYNTMENPNLGYEVMKEDMLDGKVADIICPDGVNFESLAGKGLFADWYDFMDADEEFSRDDYLPNFFETMEYHGKLQRLGFSYTIETAAAQTQLAGEEQGQSLGELLTTAQEKGIDFVTYSPAEFLTQTWLRNLQTGCIDRKTAECCFDSPEVVQLLELLGSIPKGDAFYAAVEAGEYAPGYERSWRDGSVLLEVKSIAQPIDLRAVRRHDFGDADITLTGFPMVQDEGNGGVFAPLFTVCINAQSTEHEAIWDFMKFFLTEDYQQHLYESMPIHEGAFEHKLEEAEGMVTASVGMAPGTFIGEMEEWESDLLREYVHGIRKSFYYDHRIQDILLEEAEKMLAGDQTPQECAEMMQSRVSIYLSEQS